MARANPERKIVGHKAIQTNRFDDDRGCHTPDVVTRLKDGTVPLRGSRGSLSDS